MKEYSDLSALFFNGTLKKSPGKSNTDGLIEVVRELMEKQGVSTEVIRAVDHDIATGMQPDMREHGWETDEWPEIYNPGRVPISIYYYALLLTNLYISLVLK